MAASKSSTAQKKKKGHQGNRVPTKKVKYKIFDKRLVVTLLISAVAVVALLMLTVAIISPKTFNRIFFSTPLDRHSTVMTIGDHEVTYDEYVNLVLYYRDLVEQQDGANSLAQNPSEQKKLLEFVEALLIDRYTKVELGRQYGIELTDTDRARVDNAISLSISEMGGYSTFLRALDRTYQTASLYYANEYTEELLRKIDTAVRDGEFGSVSDEEIQQYISDRTLYGVKHILITANYDSSTATEAEKEAAFAKALKEAQPVLQRARNGENFNTLINLFNKDTGQTAAGYVINAEGHPYDINSDNTLSPTASSDTFVEEFTQATLELEIGEISGLVKTSFGYHIILRVSVDELVKNTIVQTRYDEALQKTKDTIVITYGRGYQFIDSLENFKWDFQYPYIQSTDPLPTPVEVEEPLDEEGQE